MTTATHNGMVYQIGGIYEFSDNGNKKTIGVLDTVEPSKFPFNDRYGDSWMNCGLVMIPNGTITPAPVDLNNGEIYQFDHCERTYFGQYVKDRNSFFSGDNKICGSSQVSNIIKLVPGVK